MKILLVYRAVTLLVAAPRPRCDTVEYGRRFWTESNRTVFNITPCFNDFEKHFSRQVILRVF